MKRKLNVSDLERSKERIKNSDTVIGERLDLIGGVNSGYNEADETHEDFLNAGMSENEANFATSNVIDYDNIY